jgi:serine protease Do
VLLKGNVAELLNLPDGCAGLLVQGVATGSPAFRLGIRGGSIPASIAGHDLLLGGDVIVEVMGIAVGEPGMSGLLREKFAELQPDDLASAVVLRGGKRLELAVPSRNLTYGNSR